MFKWFGFQNFRKKNRNSWRISDCIQLIFDLPINVMSFYEISLHSCEILIPLPCCGLSRRKSPSSDRKNNFQKYIFIYDIDRLTTFKIKINEQKCNFCINIFININQTLMKINSLCKWHLVPGGLHFDPLASESFKTSDTDHIYRCLNILGCFMNLPMAARALYPVFVVVL